MWASELIEILQRHAVYGDFEVTMAALPEGHSVVDVQEVSDLEESATGAPYVILKGA